MSLMFTELVLEHIVLYGSQLLGRWIDVSVLLTDSVVNSLLRL